MLRIAYLLSTRLFWCLYKVKFTAIITDFVRRPLLDKHKRYSLWCLVLAFQMVLKNAIFTEVFPAAPNPQVLDERNCFKCWDPLAPFRGQLQQRRDYSEPRSVAKWALNGAVTCWYATPRGDKSDLGCCKLISS